MHGKNVDFRTWSSLIHSRNKPVKIGVDAKMENSQIKRCRRLRIVVLNIEQHFIVIIKQPVQLRIGILSVVGKRHLAGRPLEKHTAKLVLKCAHVTTEHRLGNIVLFGRLGEIKRFRQR